MLLFGLCDYKQCEKARVHTSFFISRTATYTMSILVMLWWMHCHRKCILNEHTRWPVQCSACHSSSLITIKLGTPRSHSHGITFQLEHITMIIKCSNRMQGHASCTLTRVSTTPTFEKFTFEMRGGWSQHQETIGTWNRPVHVVPIAHRHRKYAWANSTRE